jgi:hypothetical protein
MTIFIVWAIRLGIIIFIAWTSISLIHWLAIEPVIFQSGVKLLDAFLAFVAITILGL